MPCSDTLRRLAWLYRPLTWDLGDLFSVDGLPPPRRPAQVCLPGGKRDEEDADDAATALREANEEVRGLCHAASLRTCLLLHPPIPPTQTSTQLA